MPNIVWIWLATFVVFLILEVLTPSMLFIGFSLSALVSGVFAYFFPESYYWQIGIFIVVSAILLPLTRKMAKRFTKESPQITNVDAIIGKVGLVIKTIDPDKAGQIKVNGEIWRAVSEELIQEHEKATILKIIGTTVYVEKKL
ncbi:MAG TPA: NfeD family protein [candidate division Zixibacteria bacterium]|nr:NfeD family protein [candidate division Zixibacteria bacterium]